MKRMNKFVKRITRFPMWRRNFFLLFGKAVKIQMKHDLYSLYSKSIIIYL